MALPGESGTKFSWARRKGEDYAPLPALVLSSWDGCLLGTTASQVSYSYSLGLRHPQSDALILGRWAVAVVFMTAKFIH